MSVLLIDTNKNGKYEFTKEELQKILDTVEQEAFERGMSFGRRMQEPKEREYVYVPTSPPNNPLNPYVTWNEVTCTATDPSLIKTTGNERGY